jgi:hypothetical protein
MPSSELLIDLTFSDSVEPSPSVEQNLSWLSHETKINEALSIANEAKARSALNSVAISTISELTTTIKELKKEVASLKSEVSILRENGKKTLTPEEKEELIAYNEKWLNDKKIVDMLQSTTIDGINPMTQIQRDGFISDLQFASEFIANNVKTIEHGKTIMETLITGFCNGCRIISCLASYEQTMKHKFRSTPVHSVTAQWVMFKKYKTLYKLLYEIDKRQVKRFIISGGTYHICHKIKISSIDDATSHYFALVELEEGNIAEYEGIKNPTRPVPIKTPTQETSTQPSYVQPKSLGKKK